MYRIGWRELRALPRGPFPPARGAGTRRRDTDARGFALPSFRSLAFLLFRVDARRPLRDAESMIRLAARTRRTPQEVIRTAVVFFGPDGLGLRIASQAPDRASFEGGGGFVTVGAQARHPSGETEVVVDAREWEADARRFLGKV